MPVPGADQRGQGFCFGSNCSMRSWPQDQVSGLLSLLQKSSTCQSTCHSTCIAPHMRARSQMGEQRLRGSVVG